MATAIPIIGLVASLVGTGVAYYGQQKAADAAEKANNMQAAVIEREGMQGEEIARGRLRKLLSSQRALYAKAGVDLSTGSPLTVLADTAMEGEKEALNIRRGTRESADITRIQGSAVARGNRTAAAGTLLSSLSSSAGSYSAYSTRAK